jgi:hypothetical protein
VPVGGQVFVACVFEDVTCYVGCVGGARGGGGAGGETVCCCQASHPGSPIKTTQPLANQAYLSGAGSALALAAKYEHGMKRAVLRSFLETLHSLPRACLHAEPVEARPGAWSS